MNSIWSGVHERHDILLVDQRGTGGSHPLACPPPPQNPDVGVMIKACLASLNGDSTQYGTAAAADDLEAVRAALGYRTLDLYGISYGATLAQVYLARHPRSVRTVVLDGATLLDVPFFARFAVNGQRALDLVARRCAREPACARAFPSWPQQLRSLIEAWNATPVTVAPELTLTGDDLAGVIQSMTRSAASAASIPLAVSRAARGDYATLARQIPSSGSDDSADVLVDLVQRALGRPRRAGPVGHVPRRLRRRPARELPLRVRVRARPRRAGSNLARVRSNVPVLALVGGADPQDPAANIAGLGRRCRRRASSSCPSTGTASASTAACRGSSQLFVDRGSAATLDVRCVRSTEPPPFALG